MPSDSKKLSMNFIYATLGEDLLKSLRKNSFYCESGLFDQKAVDIVSYYDEGFISELDYSSRASFVSEIIVPVANSFIEYVSPFYKNKPRQINWVIKEFIANPEIDLTKLAKNLMYFENLKQSSVFDGCKDLMQYKSYNELDTTLLPFRMKKNEKADLNLFRHLSDNERSRVILETIVVYEGKEGKIVIPNTVFAGKYWSNNTKLCISGEKAFEKFMEANQKSPIVIFIPKGYEDEKIALNDGKLFNARDEIIEEGRLYEPHQKLLDAAMGKLSPKAAEGLKSLMSGSEIRSLGVKYNSNSGFSIC